MKAFWQREAGKKQDQGVLQESICSRIMQLVI